MSKKKCLEKDFNYICDKFNNEYNCGLRWFRVVEEVRFITEETFGYVSMFRYGFATDEYIFFHVDKIWDNYGINVVNSKFSSGSMVELLEAYGFCYNFKGGVL